MPTIKKYTGEITGSVTGTVQSFTRPDRATMVAAYKTADFGAGSFTLADKDGTGFYTGRYKDEYCDGPALMEIVRDTDEELVLIGSFDGGHWRWELAPEEEDEDR